MIGRNGAKRGDHDRFGIHFSGKGDGLAKVFRCPVGVLGKFGQKGKSVGSMDLRSRGGPLLMDGLDEFGVGAIPMMRGAVEGRGPSQTQ